MRKKIAANRKYVSPISKHFSPLENNLSLTPKLVKLHFKIQLQNKLQRPRGG